MDASGAAVLTALIAGALVGAFVVWLWLSRHHPDHGLAHSTAKAPGSMPADISADLVIRAISALPGTSMVVDSGNGTVLSASARAADLGLIQPSGIADPEIARVAVTVRHPGQVVEEELNVRRPAFRGGRLDLLARITPITARANLVMLEDLSSARRVDEVRRDFVANVSHELKTPVGALSLLAEAVLAASDDPDEVRHFAGRMQLETARLSNLVADLVDLSRLQGDDPMANAEAVDVDAVVTEAIDSMRMAADSGRIEIVAGGTHHLIAHGVESQLVTALRNLLSNAVSYSPPNTRIAVATKTTNQVIEISVTDQGIGIPAAEVDRIFERFYRVDQARSRVTGGTGLGLAIVKHVCRNHGGDVTVWSVEGEGSTFTLRLPSVRGNVVRPAQASPLARSTGRDSQEVRP
ncbi:MAG: ATP-binding protein [Candidatus Nanopelagicales bacterium]